METARFPTRPFRPGSLSDPAPGRTHAGQTAQMDALLLKVRARGVDELIQGMEPPNDEELQKLRDQLPPVTDSNRRVQRHFLSCPPRRPPDVWYQNLSGSRFERKRKNDEDGNTENQITCDGVLVASSKV